jgi:hypothetical protein
MSSIALTALAEYTGESYICLVYYLQSFLVPGLEFKVLCLLQSKILQFNESICYLQW